MAHRLVEARLPDRQSGEGGPHPARRLPEPRQQALLHRLTEGQLDGRDRRRQLEAGRQDQHRQRRRIPARARRGTAADGHVYGATTHAGEGKVTIWDLADNRSPAPSRPPARDCSSAAAENSPYVWADSMFATPANHIYVFDKNPPFKVVKVIEDGTQPLHPEFTPTASWSTWPTGRRMWCGSIMPPRSRRSPRSAA